MCLSLSQQSVHISVCHKIILKNWGHIEPSYRLYRHAETTAAGEPSPKRPRSDSFQGAVVEVQSTPVHPHYQQQQQHARHVGLLQIAPSYRTEANSSSAGHNRALIGSSSTTTVTTTNNNTAIMSSSSTVVSHSSSSHLVRTSGGGASVPHLGIPTPSLSGVLTGIKLPPLFSLPGARAEPPMLLTTTSTSSNNSSQASEEKPVTYVLGETELNNYHLVKIAVVAKG